MRSLTTIIALIFSVGLHAQETVPATGGDATGVKETSINLEMNVYPNPTTDYLTLKVEESKGLSYQLFDMQGKVIENKKVTEEGQAVKTFRIIKK